MTQLLITMLGSLLRMALLAAFGALIERGVWTTGQVEQVALGLSGLLVVGAWALWNHYKARLKFLTALESPAGTTEEHVEEKVKSGTGATIVGGGK